MFHIYLDYIKKNFPQYDKYFLDEDSIYQDEILQTEVNNAKTELGTYVQIPETFSDQIRLFLLTIVKYRGFNRLHGDTEFDNKPQIVKDYDNLIKLLTGVKAGDSLTGAEGKPGDHVRIHARSRKFGEGFDDPEGGLSCTQY